MDQTPQTNSLFPIIPIYISSYCERALNSIHINPERSIVIFSLMFAIYNQTLGNEQEIAYSKFCQIGLVYINYYLINYLITEERIGIGYVNTVKSLNLIMLLLLMSKVFGVLNDQNSLILSFLYIVMIPFDYCAIIPELLLSQNKIGSNSSIETKSDCSIRNKILKTLKVLLIMLMNSDSLFAIVMMAYVMYLLTKRSSAVSIKLAEMKKELITTKIELNNEIQKWRGIVEKLPFGVIIMNKSQCLYSNQMLTQQLMAQTENEAVSRVLQWCMQSEPLDSWNKSTNNIKLQSLNHNNINFVSHQNTPRSSGRIRQSSSIFDNEKRLYSSRFFGNNFLNDVKKKQANLLQQNSPHISNRDNNFFENTSQINQYELLSNDVSCGVDYSKVFIHLQQAFSKTPQPIYFSKSAIKVRGYSRSNSIVEFTPLVQGYNQLRHSIINESFSNAYSNAGETQMLEKKQFEIWTSIIPWNEEDTILLVVKDVTDQRNYSKIKIQNKYKSMALSTLSHELKTPIHVILNSLNNIKERIGNKDPLLTMYHKVSLSSGIILFHKVNDLLDYSLIEQNKICIDKCQFNIRDIIIDVVEAFEYQARLKQLNFQCFFDTNLPQSMNSDPNRIKQILFNLVSNAIKFTTKGFIKIYVYLEELQRMGYIKKYIAFEVEDTGIGIRRQEIPYLCELFGINKINKEKKNVGLGLTISHLLSKKLGLPLDVDSVYGQGTIISFKIKDSVIQDDGVEENKIMTQIEEEEKSFESENSDKLILVNSSTEKRRRSLKVGQSTQKRRSALLRKVDSLKEIECIMFESIANERIQEKIVFNNIRRIKVVHKFSTFKNQDLSRLMKEHLSVTMNIEGVLKQQIIQSSNDKDQCQNNMSDSSIYYQQMNHNNSALEFTLNNFQKKISKVSSKHKKSSKRLNLMQKEEISEETKHLGDLNDTKVKTNKIKHQRSRSLLPSQIDSANVSSLHPPQGKCGLIRKSTLNKKKRPKLRIDKINVDSLQCTSELQSSVVKSNILVTKKGSNLKNLMSKLNQKSIRDEIIKHKGMIGSQVSFTLNHASQIFNFKEASLMNLHQNGDPQINAQASHGDYINRRYGMVEFNSLASKGDNIKERESQNNQSAIVVTDTDLCVTEFDDEEKRTKMDNFIKIMYQEIQDASKDQLNRNCGKPQIMDNDRNEKDNESKPQEQFKPCIVISRLGDNMPPLKSSSLNQDQNNQNMAYQGSLKQGNSNDFQVQSSEKYNYSQPINTSMSRFNPDNIISYLQQQNENGLSFKDFKYAYNLRNNQIEQSQESMMFNGANSSKNRYYSANQQLINSLTPNHLMKRGTSQFTRDRLQQNLQHLSIVKESPTNLKLNQQISIVNEEDSRKHSETVQGKTPSQHITLEEMENLQRQMMIDQVTEFATQVAQERRECGCPSILIVEDDEFIKIITKALLLQVGFELHDVGNGQLAVEAMEEQEAKCQKCKGYLIVLMDYDMPIMNGVEATRKIRDLIEEGKVKDVPIIAVSAFVASQEIERCLNSGMNDYISKPFTQHRLYSVLMRWMPIKLQHDTLDDEEEEDDYDHDEQDDDNQDLNNYE